MASIRVFGSAQSRILNRQSRRSDHAGRSIRSGDENQGRGPVAARGWINAAGPRGLLAPGQAGWAG